MKKFTLALLAMAAVLFGTGPVVNAYPPGAGVVTITPASKTVAQGGTVTVAGSCLPGETVTVTLGSATATAVCSAAGTGPTGSAATAGGYSIAIAAPTTVGPANGTVVGSTTGSLGPAFVITVTATIPPVTQGGDTNGGSAAGGGTLPSTGSDSTSTALLIGFGSLLMGLGLFGTARVRRNQLPASG